MKSIGRRGGNSLQKQVLDILSYEARAALHRCYSAAWSMLVLPHLSQKHALTSASRAFLNLWHLDPYMEGDLGELSYFHLFHGHVFGLHPAGGEFLSTPSGRWLVGNWLHKRHVKAATEEPERWLKSRGREKDFRRLLHGLFVAICQYAERRQVLTLGRRKQPLASGGTDLVKLEHAIAQRSTGRRPRHQSLYSADD